MVDARPVPALVGRWRTRVSYRRKVTHDDVRAIRWRAAQGDRQADIAAVYNLSASSVWSIVERHSFPGVVGLPLSARYWTTPADQQWGVMLWLVYLLWVLRGGSLRTS